MSISSSESLSTIPRRMSVIQAHKEEGGSVAAVLPIHYPRALLRAFNILPVEVWGPPGTDPTAAAAHLQPYVCSIARNALSFLLTGGLEVADFLVVPHACDSLQGLGSILTDFVRPRQPVYTIYLPRGRRESDVAFLTEELGFLFQRLSQVTDHTPSLDTLMRCILREEAADQLLARLHQRRQQLPLTDLAFYRLVRSREYLPAEVFTELAQQALETGSEEPRSGIPLLISGIVLEPMQILELISEAGGSIVADDLACCGRRLYPPGESQDPFRRMAESIIYAPADPTRGDSIEERRQQLLRQVALSGAAGIIFYDVKFCEPELFDLPLLRQELQLAGIPSLIIEIDINDSLSHQGRTRLQAFLEMLA